MQYLFNAFRKGTANKFSTIICYNIIGDITIPNGMTMTVVSDLNGASPQFTLTCISTGGPATTVTWTKYCGDEMSVLNDAATAQYTHTLTVTGLPIGLYQCNVSNDKPSMASAQLEFQGNHFPLHYINRYCC